jgi:amino acid adenylation domain-containing protein/thioester reductase-like protein
LSEPMSTIERAPETNLSFAQERMWFLEQLIPGSAAYNVSTATRLRGHLRRDSLRAAGGALLRRHPMLRARFTSVAGVPRCELAAATSLPFAESEPLRMDQPGDALQEAIDHEAARPFDLVDGPLVRALIISLGEDEHVFCLTVHHLIVDGQSLKVMLADLASLYEAISSGEDLPACRSVADYLEVAAAERSAARDGAYAERISFWVDSLDGATPLGLSTDKGRPALRDGRGDRVTGRLPQAAVAKLESLARESSTSLYLTLLVAVSSLLGRYSENRDVVVGSPVANRRRSDTEHLVGLFVNTVAMRSTIDEDSSFRELVERHRNPLLEALDHADVPFDYVVGEVRPERDLSINPLFQVMFALQDGEPPRLRLEGVESAALDPWTGSARFDLEWTCWREPDGLKVRLGYRVDTFEAGSAEMLHLHFLRMLEAVADDPDARIGDVRLLDDGEEELLSTVCGSTSGSAAGDVGTLFERQVDRDADATAVVVAGVAVSYAELEKRAEAVAAELERVAKSALVVGVCAPRSTNLVASILGVLKVGAAILPLDPDDPPARRRHLLDSCDCRVVIGGGGIEWGDLDGIQILDADGTPTSPGLTRRARRRRGDATAYVIFTSGSSGSPKGVVVTQDNVVTTLLGAREWFGFTADDRFLCLAAHTFDIFYFEVLSPLICGGMVFLATREEMFDPSRLAPLVRQATVMQAVPGLMEQVIRALEGDGGPARRMRFAITGGDAVPPSLPAKMAVAFPNSSSTVLYGPTETTMVCCGVRLEDPERVQGHPIGRPLPDVSVRLYDGRRRLVPVGVPGEIYIGGRGVAQGYLSGENDRFVMIDGERFYRSGDRAKWMRDGGLTFLGRVDDQLKVRGFRVEPSEVEAMLETLPEVASATVVAVGERSSRRLAVFVVPRPSGNDRAAARRRHGEQWRELFDQTHSAASRSQGRDYTGWRSSYTGDPLPVVEMDEWLEASLSELRDHLPRRTDGLRILEVGAGTGLLVDALAPECERYVAADFSPTLAEQLRRRVRGGDGDLSSVEVLNLEAGELGRAGTGEFDAVILNSVTQYLWGLAHLDAIVRSALGTLRPGGIVFLGDVRSLCLQRTLLTSIARHRMGPRGEPGEVRGYVLREAASERELLVDPRAFVALEGSLKGVAAVDVIPRRGSHENEMTKYRYNVLLRTGRESGKEVPQWIDWRGAGMTRGRLESLLDAGQDSPIGLTGVPNALLVGDVRDRSRIWGEPIRERHASALHPDDLRDLAAAAGYDAALSWRRGDRDGGFDAVLSCQRDVGDDRYRWSWPRASGGAEEPANDPLLPLIEEPLQRRILLTAAETLPGYMVPAAVHLLGRLPLRANDKVDREMLSTLGVALRPPAVAGSGAVVNRTERAVASAWREVLGVEDVDRRTSFFTTGGTSLGAIEVAVRLRPIGFRISAQDVFRHQTLERLAAAIDHGSIGSSAARQAPADGEAAPAAPGASSRSRPPIGAAARVLLAGATGFLGIHILHELVGRDLSASCLVRARTDSEARARLAAAWGWYFSGRELPAAQVEAVAGDVTLPTLGLTRRRWERLAAGCDQIINAAADVRHVAPAEELFAVNRDGTERLVALARPDLSTPFHHISTVGVAGTISADSPRQFTELDFLVGQSPTEEYSASKIAAEKVVRDHFGEGGRGSIVRVGTIAPHSRSGVFQRNAADHFLVRYLRSTIELAVACDWPGRQLALTPVDYLATAVIGLADLSPAPSNTTHHVIARRELYYYDLTRLLQAMGYAIQVVEQSEFPGMVLSRAADIDNELAIGGVLSLLDPPRGKRPSVDDSETRTHLEQAGIRSPDVGVEWISGFVKRLVDLGHLPPPPLGFPAPGIADVWGR